METANKFFRRMKSWWMKFAHAVGWLNTRLLLSIVYFLVFAIPAVILKLIGKDLLDRKRNTSATTYWKNKKPIEHTLESAKHQF